MARDRGSGLSYPRPTPPARTRAGWDGTSALGDTWQWDGTAWSPLTRCYADCDTSPGQRILDIFDFLCFQNAFAAGCP